MTWTLSKSPATFSPGFVGKPWLLRPRPPPAAPAPPPPRWADTDIPTRLTAATTTNARFTDVMCGSSEIQLVRRHVALGNLSDDAEDAVGELDVFRGAALILGCDFRGARARVHLLALFVVNPRARRAVPLERVRRDHLEMPLDDFAGGILHVHL